MPRCARKKFPGARYHVMARGNAKQRIFFSNWDYERFVEQLEHAVVSDNVKLYAYCLMPNHIHLFVETPLANIDRFVGRLTTAYAMYFRYKHSRPGHCFQGRYKAPLVEGDDYIVRLIRYIHLNPAKTRQAKTMDMNDRWKSLLSYRWSSLPGYLWVGKREEMIDYRWLSTFGESTKETSTRYRTYLRKCIDQDDEVLLEAMDASAFAIGDEEFVDEIEDWARRESRGRKAPQDMNIPEPALPDVEDVERAVLSAFGVSADRLHEPNVHVGPARAVFAELACRHAGLTQRAVAAYLGGVSEHAVGKLRKRFRERLGEDGALRDTFLKLDGQMSSV